MSVAAVAAFSAGPAVSSHTQDPSRQQAVLHQDVLSLQTALQSGSVATAQSALDQLQQDLQSIHPQRAGIVSSTSVNPASTMRKDLQELQSALDAGDLLMAQKALARMQDDAPPPPAPPVKAPVKAKSEVSDAEALSLKSEREDEGSGLSGSIPRSSPKDKGNLIDVMA